MEDSLHDDYLNEDATSMDMLYELFDYIPTKGKNKKKYKYIVTYKSASDPSLEAERMRFNMYVYDTYHGKDGWYYNLLTGKLERTKPSQSN